MELYISGAVIYSFLALTNAEMVGVFVDSSFIRERVLVYAAADRDADSLSGIYRLSHRSYKIFT